MGNLGFEINSKYDISISIYIFVFYNILDSNNHYPFPSSSYIIIHSIKISSFIKNSRFIKWGKPYLDYVVVSGKISIGENR